MQVKQKITGQTKMNENVPEPVELSEMEEIKKEIETVPAPESAWKPKTALGRKVKEGAINNIDFIFDSGENILEAEIVETLLPNLEEDLLLIGQVKVSSAAVKGVFSNRRRRKPRKGIRFISRSAR